MVNLLAAKGARRRLLLGREGLAVAAEHAQPAQALLGGQASLVTAQSQQLLGGGVDALGHVRQVGVVGRGPLAVRFRGLLVAADPLQYV